MLTQMVTLRNDFHNTSYRVRTAVEFDAGVAIITLTDGQTARARKVLCGMDDCTCAQHSCGIHGPQEHDGRKLLVDY